MTEQKDQKFLEFVVKSIVSNPDEVKVERKVDEMGVLLTLHVNSVDMAQIIGRKGATAQSIRSLLKIAEPEGSTRGRTSASEEINRAVGDINL